LILEFLNYCKYYFQKINRFLEITQATINQIITMTIHVKEDRKQGKRKKETN